MLPAIRFLRSRDAKAFAAHLRDAPEVARKPQVVLEAARLADLRALKLLVKAGADLDASWRGYRPLHALLQEQTHGPLAEPDAERLACLDWLLEHGADPEQHAAWPSARALIVAAFVGSPAYVEHLLAHDPVRDVFSAAALGEVLPLQRALEHEPELARARDGAQGLSALACAAGSRLHALGAARARALLECARLLLDAGADPNAKARSWSHEVDVAYLAIGAEHVALLELLLERGADADAALPSAAWSARVELLELCLARGAAPDRATSNGKPLLNDLVRWGQVQQALALLERGASPDVRDEEGWTALHQAASRGNLRLVRALLEAGAKRSARDAEGRTAAEVAHEKGRAKVVALLGASSGR